MGICVKTSKNSYFLIPKILVMEDKTYFLRQLSNLFSLFKWTAGLGLEPINRLIRESVITFMFSFLHTCYMVELMSGIKRDRCALTLKYGIVFSVQMIWYIIKIIIFWNNCCFKETKFIKTNCFLKWDIVEVCSTLCRSYTFFSSS